MRMIFETTDPANDCQTSKFGIERCRFDSSHANPCTYSCLADCVHISVCSITSIAYAMDSVSFSKRAVRLLLSQRKRLRDWPSESRNFYMDHFLPSQGCA